ncbi:conserved hypothetical protein [Streptomyces viridochromogenes DSM 40736]|uniref:Uncharacterized protein n=1 Tax=Streptomyces viridochromogenes (strain DSM 40736 / JCM 4977 / BCRC 1201 / Tue 494) TaxID=591159 RepID=D9XEW8_STRVT|nr:conserved hypothetical protein [Streptomyces viridochromogenes DSM 40736]
MGGRDLRRAGGPDRAGGGDPRHGGAAAVHRPPGRLPVPPGQCCRPAGQQPAPDPRHAGRDHGLGLSGPGGDASHGALAALREKASEALGRRPETGLPLLHDMRDPHLAAARNSLHWEMLAQTAQATRDERLLALVSDCHPQTLRQLRWTNTMIKILSPQVLTSV